MMRFLDKLKGATRANTSYVCVGLDSDINLIPECVRVRSEACGLNPLFEFNKAIVDATRDLVCSYKPNAAFYEANGALGLEALEKTIEYIPNEIPVILDSKRGDIGNTSEQYALSTFQHLKADAVTLSPYMGFDTVSPFATYADKTLFLLVKTSNNSSGELQDQILSDGTPVYIKVAKLIREWQERDPQKYPADLGCVVGATYPEELKLVREILPEAAILIPGLGAQGGDAKNTVLNGLGPSGSAPIIVNSSRGIIFASTGEDFAEVARQKCREFRDLLNSFKD